MFPEKGPETGRVGKAQGLGDVFDGFFTVTKLMDGGSHGVFIHPLRRSHSAVCLDNASKVFGRDAQTRGHFFNASIMSFSLLQNIQEPGKKSLPRYRIEGQGDGGNL